MTPSKVLVPVCVSVLVPGTRAVRDDMEASARAGQSR